MNQVDFEKQLKEYIQDKFIVEFTRKDGKYELSISKINKLILVNEGDYEDMFEMRFDITKVVGRNSVKGSSFEIRNDMEELKLLFSPLPNKKYIRDSIGYFNIFPSNHLLKTIPHTYQFLTKKTKIDCFSIINLDDDLSYEQLVKRIKHEITSISNNPSTI